MEQEGGNGPGAAPRNATGPEDRAAREIIRQYRRRYLLKLWPDTPFGFKVINDLALEMIQEIARVYYPEEERPELERRDDVNARVIANHQGVDSYGQAPDRDFQVQVPVLAGGRLQNAARFAIPGFPEDFIGIRRILLIGRREVDGE